MFFVRKKACADKKRKPHDVKAVRVDDRLGFRLLLAVYIDGTKGVVFLKVMSVLAVAVNAVGRGIKKTANVCDEDRISSKNRTLMLYAFSGFC